MATAQRHSLCKSRRHAQTLNSHSTIFWHWEQIANSCGKIKIWRWTFASHRHTRALAAAEVCCAKITLQLLPNNWFISTQANPFLKGIGQIQPEISKKATLHVGVDVKWACHDKVLGSGKFFPGGVGPNPIYLFNYRIEQATPDISDHSHRVEPIQFHFQFSQKSGWAGSTRISA